MQMAPYLPVMHHTVEYVNVSLQYLPFRNIGIVNTHI